MGPSVQKNSFRKMPMLDGCALNGFFALFMKNSDERVNSSFPHRSALSHLWELLYNTPGHAYIFWCCILREGLLASTRVFVWFITFWILWSESVFTQKHGFTFESEQRLKWHSENISSSLHWSSTAELSRTKARPAKRCRADCSS